jgi:hypothetical protein
MAFSTETIGRLYASGRNYANLAIGFASGIGIISAAQNKGLMDSLSEIGSGISQIVHGATSAWQILAVIAAPIIGPILAKMASNSAKTSNQAIAVKAAITDPNTPITPEVKDVVISSATEVKKI